MTTLLLITLCAAIAPPIGMRLRVPGVVLEIALGVVIGPQVLGWAAKDEIITVLSQIGLAMLIFLAGYEIDLPETPSEQSRRARHPPDPPSDSSPGVAGRPLRLAVAGWLISLGLGLLIALGF